MSFGKRIKALDGKEIAVTLPLDIEGFIDRECPSCERFFKVKPGTGLPNSEHVICPYCGHKGSPKTFFSKEQVAYAHAIVGRQAQDALTGDLQDMAREIRGPFVTMEVKPGPRRAVEYRHQELPTRLACTNCGCEYKVDGEQGFCPDCAQTN